MKHPRLRLVIPTVLTALCATLLAGPAADAAQPTAIVAGTVTGVGGAPVQAEVQLWTSNAGGGRATSGPDGAFQIAHVPAGTYTMLLIPSGSDSATGVYPAQYDGGTLSPNSARTITVGDSGTVTIDPVLVAGFHLTGTLTADGGTPASVQLTAVPANGSASNGLLASQGGTVSGPTYRSVPLLPGGQYRATFSAGTDWADASYTFDSPVSTTDVPLDAHLAAAAWIRGTMTKDADTPGFPTVLVLPETAASSRVGCAGFGPIWTATADTTGQYAIGGLPAGSYCVSYLPAATGDTFPLRWPTGLGQPVTVTAGQTAELDPTLHVGARLTGTLSYRNASGGLTPADAQLTVFARQPDGSLAPTSNVEDDTTGTWSSWNVLDPGTYAVEFSPGPIDDDYDFPPQFYGGPSAATATSIQAGVGVTSTDVVLQPATFASQRVSGATRYETAAAVADAVIPNGQRPQVVYLASGTAFPDALSAGPAAVAGGGVVLTTDPGSLPSTTAAELQRLHPQDVQIVGGTAAVSTTVAQQVEALTGATPGRIQGIDRYDTSRQIARTAFPHGAATAFIATGANYPDALSAGAAAAKLGGPVILVDGNATTLDAATAQLLTTLGVTHVYIVGGDAVVSTGIETALQGLDGGIVVDRLGGADRWSTSTEVSQAAFADADNTVLATGMSFADAVIAAPLAAKLGAPIELVAPSCIPEVTMSKIIQTGGTSLTLVGGPSALSAAVAAADACSGPYTSGSLDLASLP